MVKYLAEVSTIIIGFGMIWFFIFYKGNENRIKKGFLIAICLFIVYYSSSQQARLQQKQKMHSELFDNCESLSIKYNLLVNKSKEAADALDSLSDFYFKHKQCCKPEVLEKD